MTAGFNDTGLSTGHQSVNMNHLQSFYNIFDLRNY